MIVNSRNSFTNHLSLNTVRSMSKTSNDIGQHLFIGLPGLELDRANRRLLNTIQPGGIVLFARNINTPDQLLALVRALRHELPHRPIIAIDQENQCVNRLRSIIGELPGIAELKSSGHPARVEDFGQAVGQTLRQFGIDLDFAPVFDLERFSDSVDNALRERCWGKTAAEVIAWAGAFLDGLERAGVVACPKHFPGLGGAALDSHERLPTIRDDITEDIEPYRHFIGRLSAVMVGHGQYPAFDNRPASLSHAIITNLLRRQLGFTGLVLTDDLEMGAIQSFEHAVVEALEAGADMLLVCHNPEKILAAHEALSRGRINSERFAESQQRLQQFRSKWIGHRP
jgi:beta-N-acetylhexosaminidase